LESIKALNVGVKTAGVEFGVGRKEGWKEKCQLDKKWSIWLRKLEYITGYNKKVVRITW